MSQDIKSQELNNDLFLLSRDADFVQHSDGWQEEINRANVQQLVVRESLCCASLAAMNGKSFNMFGIRCRRPVCRLGVAKQHGIP